MEILIIILLIAIVALLIFFMTRGPKEDKSQKLMLYIIENLRKEVNETSKSSRK